MTPAERKRLQRQRDKISGWQEVTVRIAKSRAQELRDFAAGLPDPEPPKDPRQLDMLDEIDRQLGNGGDVSQSAFDM